MPGPMLSLVLDILIVVLLAATLFHAVRLTIHLRRFREGRHEMDRLVRDLANNVHEAQLAIAGLQQTTSVSGDKLQGLISEAKGLSEELQLINEAGNALAGRLETLAERNSSSAVAAQGYARGGFQIQDRGYGSDGPPPPDSYASGEPAPDEGDLKSQAERELYEALRGGKTRR